MKLCPKCQKTFSDELNFCLEDGLALVEAEGHSPDQTLAFSQEPTLQLRYENQTNNKSEVVTKPHGVNRQNFPYQQSRQPNLFLIFGTLFGLGLLTVAGAVGGYFYLRPKPPANIGWYPTPVFSPPPKLSPTPTPKIENNLKVEILDKVTDGFGHKYLKCKVTNISEYVVDFSGLSLAFYQGEVKIKDASPFPELKILKPNQTIPVWVNLYDTDNYTSVKVKEPTIARPKTKPIEQIYPALEFSQTEMKGELGYMSVNFRQYRKIFYKVSGIVENPKDEKISADIYVLFYDENAEIVGISKTSASNLIKGEKTKFEVQEVETDMFGKPKTFEIIAISDR
jgi:hypothetical protein